MIFFRRLFEISPLFVTMLQIAARGIVLAAGLGLTVGAASSAEAGQIITYNFLGSVDCGTGCNDTITGSPGRFGSLQPLGQHRHFQFHYQPFVHREHRRSPFYL